MSKFNMFTFKEEEYTLKQLLDLHKMGKRFYSSGEIIDITTGHTFDISEIYNKKSEYYQEFNIIKDKLQDKSTSRVAWAMNQDQIDKEKKRLNKKFNNKNISLSEMELLLKLEKNMDITKNLYITLKDSGTFYKKYHNYKYPEDLSVLYIGRLHLLLDFMTYKNEIKRTNRGNAKYPELNELVKFMRTGSKRVLNETLRELKRHRIIDYRTDNGNKIIYINPLFSERNLKIHPEIYIRFKEELDDVLSDKEIMYLELLTGGDIDSCTLILSE